MSPSFTVGVRCQRNLVCQQYSPPNPDRQEGDASHDFSATGHYCLVLSTTTAPAFMTQRTF